MRSSGHKAGFLQWRPRQWPQSGKLSDKAFVRPLWHDEPRSWPQFGIATARLFEGLSDDEAHAFYYNEYHLNASGAKLYSRAIAPALGEAFLFRCRTTLILFYTVWS